MVDIVNFDKWDIYKGNAEGSGRSEKDWLIYKNMIGLFKYPKSEYTTEHISEKLASDIAALLDIPCAKIDIGMYSGRIGSMSYIINKANERLVEGVSVISSDEFFPGYDEYRLYDNVSKWYYSLNIVLPVIKENKLEKEFFEMLIFDALIGNTDRHHSNWAFLTTDSKKYRFCPLYDNGSSLCCYINESDIDNYLGKDLNRFKALITTKSRSRIRINPESKKEPTHSEVLKFIYSSKEYNKYCISIVKKISQRLTKTNVENILREYPDSILTIKRKKLISKFLLGKAELICNIFKKGDKICQ